MWKEIKLDQHCKIIWSVNEVFLRRYFFKNLRLNLIEDEVHYDVYLCNRDHKDKFKVTSFMKDDIYFDTFNDAETYIMHEFANLKLKIDEEEKLKTTFIERRKHNGEKEYDK